MPTKYYKFSVFTDFQPIFKLYFFIFVKFQQYTKILNFHRLSKLATQDIIEKQPLMQKRRRKKIDMKKK